MRVLFLVVISPFFSLVSNAKTLEVCSSCEFKELETALEHALPNDDIFIKSGFYPVQELKINKQINICGEQGTVLDGGGKTILYIHHDSVSVRDLKLQNIATNYVEDRAAIKSNNSDYLLLQNIVIRDAFFGILLEKSKHGIIERCDIEGKATETTYLESSNGNAIHLWYCDSMRIQGNSVKRHRDGIYFEFVNHTLIHNNHSEANMRYGLHFMFSHHNVYSNNLFLQNGAGVAVMYSSNVLMHHNRFVDNWGESAYGLLLKDITDSELENNLFYNNTIAISADNSSRIKIHHNRFDKNGYALRVFGNCTDNTIERNDFMQNSFDVTTNSSTNYNSFTGNYWEEYNGYDLDKDGIGDVPYRPVKLFTYILAQSQASIILMRSTFIDLLNLAEKVTPVLTPETLIDEKPLIKPVNDNLKISS